MDVIDEGGKILEIVKGLSEVVVGNAVSVKEVLG
jgi:hypothetical protein